MTLDAAWLFASLIPGGIGFVMFVYGRKQSRWPYLVAGILMMGYPYLTPTMLSMAGVGAAICVALWYLVRSGY